MSSGEGACGQIINNGESAAKEACAAPIDALSDGVGPPVSSDIAKMMERSLTKPDIEGVRETILDFTEVSKLVEKYRDLVTLRP